MDNNTWKIISSKIPADLFPSTIVVLFFILNGPRILEYLTKLENSFWQILCVVVFMVLLVAVTVIFILSVIWHFRLIRNPSQSVNTGKKEEKGEDKAEEKRVKEIKLASQL